MRVGNMKRLLFSLTHSTAPPRVFDGAAEKRSIFVGIASAMQWVFLGTVAGKELKEICLLEKAAASNHLVIQSGSGDSPEKPDRGQKRAMDDYSVF